MPWITEVQSKAKIVFVYSVGSLSYIKSLGRQPSCRLMGSKTKEAAEAKLARELKRDGRIRRLEILPWKSLSNTNTIASAPIAN